MTEETTETKRKPDYKGDGVAVWFNQSRSTGLPYLYIKIVGHSPIVAFADVKNDKAKV